jgi:hypothetical protein
VEFVRHVPYTIALDEHTPNSFQALAVSHSNFAETQHRYVNRCLVNDPVLGQQLCLAPVGRGPDPLAVRVDSFAGCISVARGYVVFVDFSVAPVMFFPGF